MKNQFWVTIAAVSALWQPTFALADGTQGSLPMPQSSASQSAGPGHFLPRIDPALPNRRVPSLSPPSPDNGHPVTPAEAWPKQLPSDKPEPPSMTSDVDKNGTGNALFGKDQLDIKGPIDGINDADTADEQ